MTAWPPTAVTAPVPLPSAAEGAGVLQRSLAVAALVLASVDIVPWLRDAGGGADPTQGDPIAQGLWAAVYGLVLVALVARPDRLLDTPLHGRSVWLLAALPPVSALWSDVPSVSLRQGGGIALAVLLAFFLATRFEERQLVVWLSWTMLALGAVSAGVALLLPARGLDHLHGDAWSGIFSTKNDFGRAMAFGFLLWILRFATGEGRRALCAGACAAALALVFMSGSRTALAVVAAVGVLVPLLAFLRARPVLLWAAVSLVAAAGGAGAFWLDARGAQALASPVVNDELTGRSTIWLAVRDMIGEHPLLGYGQGAFWRGLDGPSAVVWERSGVLAAHAHNGFLDLALNVGVLGVALFALTAVLAVRRAVLAYLRSGGLAALWPLAFLAFLLLYNVTESTLVVPNSLFWVLYATILLRPPAPGPRLPSEVPA